MTLVSLKADQSCITSFHLLRGQTKKTTTTVSAVTLFFLFCQEWLNRSMCIHVKWTGYRRVRWQQLSRISWFFRWSCYPTYLHTFIYLFSFFPQHILLNFFPLEQDIYDRPDDEQPDPDGEVELFESLEVGTPNTLTILSTEKRFDKKQNSVLFLFPSRIKVCAVRYRWIPCTYTPPPMMKVTLWVNSRPLDFYSDISTCLSNW